MKKIYNLFINENIKTWKKFSTALAITFCIVALIVVLALTHLAKYMNEKEESERLAQKANWREAIQEEIQKYEEQLLDETISQKEKSEFETIIEIYKIKLKYGIDDIGFGSWKAEIISRMLVTHQIDEKLLKLIENDDFLGYIQVQKDETKQLLDNNEITEQTYNDEMIILNLYEKCEIGKNSSHDIDWRQMVIQDIRAMQQSLRRGIDDQTNKILSVEKKQEYENKIKMDIYRLENDILPLEYADQRSYRMIFESFAISVETAIIAIFAIIIAGGSISSETSSGTIKFWALTPNKRWKILTAKILSILFYIVILTTIMALLTIVCGNIFFDTIGNEYLYMKNGNVETTGNTLFIIGYYIAKIIPVIFFAIFALMISALTRNSSVSIGLSVATYMGNGTVMAVLNSLITKDWMKFIPFNNLNISEKIFPNFEGLTEKIQTIATSGSLGFSLAVLGICIILMLVTAYDSFNNRDIV